MSILSYLDSFNVSTGSIGTTMVRTGYGFEPKALIVWGFGRTETTQAYGNADMKGGFGAAVSPSSRFYAFFSDTDNDPSPEFNAALSLDRVFAAAGGLLDLQSIDSGGATFVIDGVFSTAYRIHVLAIGGGAITNVGILSLTGLVSAGNKSHTGLGFQPNAAIFGASGSTGTSPTTGTFSVGAAAGPNGSITQANSLTSGINSGGDTSANSSTESLVSSNAFYVRSGGGRTPVNVVNWDSDGATLTWNSGTNSSIAGGLFFRTSPENAFSVQLGSTVGSTGTDINITGASFRPNFGLLGGVDDDSGFIGSQSVGAFNSNSNVCHIYRSLNGLSSTTVSNGINFQDCLSMFPTTSMRVHTINSNGVTFRMSNASPGFESGFWILMGGAPQRARGGPIFF